MRAAITLGLSSLFLLLLVYGVMANAPKTGIDDSLAQGRVRAAPSFALSVLAPVDAGGAWAAAAADARVALPELRGTPLVINFWASWCPPCREETPLLERTWRAQRASGVLFLGVDQEDVRADARAFLREFDVTYPNVRDGTRETAERWGVTGYPETFFVSAQGLVVGHVIGVISSAQLREGIAASRSGRPLAARAGGALGGTDR